MDMAYILGYLSKFINRYEELKKVLKDDKKREAKKKKTIVLDADIRSFITVEKKPEIIINSTSSSDMEDDTTVSSAKYSIFS